MTIRPGFARHRRLRLSAAVRDLLRETRLDPQRLIAPLFVTDDESLAGPIATLPGVQRHHVECVAEVAAALAATGIRGLLLFGVPKTKDDSGSGAWRADGVVPRALQAICAAGTEMALFADVCLCQYTTNGHCERAGDGHVHNDETIGILVRCSLAYARAGASFVAPSGMMDGAVLSIRRGLDAAGFTSVGIMAYSVKHASALYAPFRDAARSEPATGDRRAHQLDPANPREALREALSDVSEGADILMVKPALTNLDTLSRLRRRLPDVPLAAFEVSGEYAMQKAAAERGWIDERAVALEHLTAIQRAGADLIVSYRAAEVARWLWEGA